MQDTGSVQNKGMTEASLIIGIFVVGISIVLVGLATLIVGILALRNARRSVGLAENRMEYLREEQERLAFLREERWTLVEELKQERQERLEAQQNADHLEREHKGFPEAQQEGPQLGQDRTMKPPQEVSGASSATDVADEERLGGISNTGTEGHSSETYDDPDLRVTGDSEPAVPPKEVGQGTTDDPRPEATGGAAQEEHETQQGPARRPQEDPEHWKVNVLARAMRHLRHR